MERTLPRRTAARSPEQEAASAVGLRRTAAGPPRAAAEHPAEKRPAAATNTLLDTYEIERISRELDRLIASSKAAAGRSKTSRFRLKRTVRSVPRVCMICDGGAEAVAASVAGRRSVRTTDNRRRVAGGGGKLPPPVL